MGIETYNPKKKVRIQKGDTVPVLVDVGSRFATLGGLMSFFVSSFMMSFKTFFKTKKKIRGVVSRHEKTLDLR